MPRNTANPAIIPKARGMFGARITKQNYSELCRKRTVGEIARFLKSHPYFENSLASLSEQDPHRGQLEELLRKDIYIKYERLAHYVPRGDSFGTFFILGCEVTELLLAHSLISIKSDKRYISSLPSFLIQKVSFDLMELAKVTDFDELLQVVKHTPYHKLLSEIRDIPPNRRLLVAETSLRTFYYRTVLKGIAKDVPKSQQHMVKTLFLEEIELSNINTLARIKQFFSGAFTSAEIKKLMIPYSYLLPKKNLYEMCEAEDFETLCQLIESSSIGRRYASPVAPNFLIIQQKKRYKRALMLLHLTTSPSVSLAAFIMLSELERLNIVNVIEGVRYKLPPPEIESLLRG